MIAIVVGLALGVPSVLLAVWGVSSGPGRLDSSSSEIPSKAELVYSTLTTVGNGEDANVFARHDGTDIQLTDYRGPDFAPSLSLSGEAVAFVSDREDPGNMDIYVMEADGTDVRRVTSSPRIDARPSWSPSGNEIVFARDDGKGHFEIWVSNLTTSTETQLTENDIDDFSPDWAPDGLLIVFQRYVGTNLELFTMHADGSAVKQLTTLDGSDRDPVWSPDGSAIAFVRDESENGESRIYVIDPELRSAKALAPAFAAPMEEPVWSADGASIAFLSREGNQYSSQILSEIGAVPTGTSLPVGLVAELNQGYRLLGIDGVV